jgi:hypothetical protein
MKEIKKFEFPDLLKKTSEEEVVVAEENHVTEDVPQEDSQSFADENSLEEVGQQLEPLRDIYLIKLTEEELEEKISIARETAISDYIASQANIAAQEEKIALLTERIAATVSEIRDTVRMELENIIEKLLELSYAIAAKVIDIELMSISQDKFIALIKRELKSMDFYQGVKIEVKDQAVADVLERDGFEVSVNNDMIGLDYKIVWCNGFLERNTSEVASQIEGILIDEIKK